MGFRFEKTIEMGRGSAQNLDWEMGCGPTPSGPSLYIGSNEFYSNSIAYLH